MKRAYLLIILTVELFQSCNFNTSGTWKNDSIDENKRQQIKLLNDKLFKAIASNNPAGIKALFSDSLIKQSGANLENLIKQVSGLLKSDQYRVLDEYDVHNIKANSPTTVPSGVSGDKDYIIGYTALNQETYVSLLLPVNVENELLITAIYGNYDNQWKINVLHFGDYSLFKKTAPDFYKLARESYGKSYLIDALNYISLAKNLLRPANDYFHYQKEKDILDFHDKVLKEANTKFALPLTLDNIDTKPKIFGISPEMIEDGLYPMVSYLTEINLKDVVNLKKENEKVKKEAGRIFSGIDKDKKYVLYRAFKEIPDGSKLVENYGFIDEIDPKK